MPDNWNQVSKPCGRPTLRRVMSSKVQKQDLGPLQSVKRMVRPRAVGCGANGFRQVNQSLALGSFASGTGPTSQWRRCGTEARQCCSPPGEVAGRCLMKKATASRCAKAMPPPASHRPRRPTSGDVGAISTTSAWGAACEAGDGAGADGGAGGVSGASSASLATGFDVSSGASTTPARAAT